MRTLPLIILLGVSLVGVSTHAADDRARSFRPVSTFLIPGGTAEIVAASPDGKWLVYTDATRDVVGAVDISRPERPHAVWERSPGQPITSVAIDPDGRYALVTGVAPGRLLILDVRDGSVAGAVPLGTQPDAVAVTKVHGATVAVVAVENEHPGEPGLVQVVTLHPSMLALSTVRDVMFPADVMAAAGLLAPDDPQPEFVAIYGRRAAVTLQENNGLAVIDFSDPSAPVLSSLFSLGRVDERAADLRADLTIRFSDSYPSGATGADAGTRQADAVAWNSDGSVLYTANEGEASFTGGRGASAFSPDGALLWDSGDALERAAMTHGQYPDARSAAKGIELEGAATGVYDGREFLFVGAERGSFIGVYALTDPIRPRLVQLLPAGLNPEGILPLPRRNLVVVASEGVGGGVLSIFRGVAERAEGTTEAPLLTSTGGTFWNALSGLAGDLRDNDRLYAVPDAALVSSIYRIGLHGSRASIETHVPVTRSGVQQAYDIEGIAVDTSILAEPSSRGFWLAIEGTAAYGLATYKPNLLVQTNADGAVLREIGLPMEVDSATGGRIRSQGFEGVAVSPDGRYLLTAVQRPFAGEPIVGTGIHTRIGRYDLTSGTWQFYFYPLETNVPPPADDWIGLSEITSLGRGWYAVVERDKLAGQPPASSGSTPSRSTACPRSTVQSSVRLQPRQPSANICWLTPVPPRHRSRSWKGSA